jgi:hypothetical protein
MIFIQILLLTIAAYLLVGTLFAVPFLIKGVGVIDEGANGGKIGFRLIILPGIIVFWPVLLKKWLKANFHKTKTP